MPVLAEQQTKKSRKRSKPHFPNTTSCHELQLLKENKAPYLKESLRDNVLAVTSTACYISSHVCMAKLEGRWIKRHNQVLIKWLQPKYYTYMLYMYLAGRLWPAVLFIMTAYKQDFPLMFYRIFLYLPLNIACCLICLNTCRNT